MSAVDPSWHVKQLVHGRGVDVVRRGDRAVDHALVAGDAALRVRGVVEGAGRQIDRRECVVAGRARAVGDVAGDHERSLDLPRHVHVDLAEREGLGLDEGCRVPRDVALRAVHAHVARERPRVVVWLHLVAADAEFTAPRIGGRRECGADERRHHEQRHEYVSHPPWHPCTLSHEGQRRQPVAAARGSPCARWRRVRRSRACARADRALDCRACTGRRT